MRLFAKDWAFRRELSSVFIALGCGASHGGDPASVRGGSSALGDTGGMMSTANGVGGRTAGGSNAGAASAGGSSASGRGGATSSSGGWPETHGGSAAGGAEAARGGTNDAAGGGRAELGGATLGGRAQTSGGNSGGSASPSGGASAGGAVASAGRGGAGGADSEVPSGYVPAWIGVGYGGIRIVSRDLGKTWGDRAYAKPDGGDDDELLRAVVYGRGTWVATGWKLVTSTDGIHWTDHGKLGDGPIPSCSIVEGLAYKSPYFYAACTPWNSPSAVFRSEDGVKWSKYGSIGDTGGHLFLTYRGGKFVAYGDEKTSFESSDALSWSVLAGVEQATYCGGTFASQSDCHDSWWSDGVWLRADWQGIISRSTDGAKFSRVYVDDAKNTLYQSRAIAAGFVAP